MALGDKKRTALMEDWGTPGGPATLDENGVLDKTQWPEVNDLGASPLTTPSASGSLITLDDAGEGPLVALTVYGKSTQDGTPTPDAPVEIVNVGDDGDLKQNVCGKNLFNVDKFVELVLQYDSAASVTTIDGRKCLRFATGSVHNKNFKAAFNVPANNGITLTMQIMKEDPSTYDALYIILSGVKTWNIATVSEWTTATLSGTADTNTYIAFSYGTSAFWYIDLDTIQAEFGTEATAYEPYQGSTATVTSGLPLCGIPVSSGGNVTINGQQYIADTLEVKADGTGKVVRRIGMRVWDGSETWIKGGNAPDGAVQFYTPKPEGSANQESLHISTHFTSVAGVNGSSFGSYFNFLPSENLGITTVSEFAAWIAEQYDAGNPVITLYRRSTPETINLTAEEVQALLALQTYKPVSNIYNDEGAYQEVKYCDDLRAEVYSYAPNKMLSNLPNKQRALHNIGGRPRKNHLDNSRFKVNQRGQTSYSGGYGIDRWGVTIYGTPAYTIGDNGLTKSSGIPGQCINKDKYNDFRGKTMTLSGIVNNQLESVTFVFPITDQSSFGAVTETTNIRLYFEPTWTHGYSVGLIGNGNVFKAIKLEEGPNQTLAYQDSDGNWQLFDDYDYTADLLECQRYFIQFDNLTTFSGYVNGSGGVGLAVFLPIQMVAVPTATTDYAMDVYGGSGLLYSGAVTSFKVDMDLRTCNAVVWPQISKTLSPTYQAVTMNFAGFLRLSAEL